MLRYLAIRDAEVRRVSNILQDIAESPCVYGVRYYDTETDQWVKPGKRGPIKDRAWREPLENIVTRVRLAGGCMSEAEMRQSFKESDDTFTEFDRIQHAKAVSSAKALGIYRG